MREVTTITIDRNVAGDTLRVIQMTDRTRASVRDRVKDVEVKVVERMDTVYIERRDSVLVQEFQGSCVASRAPSLISALKWIFSILIALAVCCCGWFLSAHIRR